MRLRCTFLLCVPPHTLLPLFFFVALCFCRHTQPHTHKMHIAVDLNAPFVVHAGSCVWRLLSSSVAMRRRGEERERSPSLFSCGCGAARVTALSWAPCPIEGGMDEGSLARVAVVVAAAFGHFPGAVAMSWGRWWWMSSPPAWWVAAGVVCLPCVDAVSWCVNYAAGPAALSSCCLLSLTVSAALRPSPSCSIPFPSGSPISSLTPATPLRVMMTAMMTMVTVRLRVVCAVLVPALLCCCLFPCVWRLLRVLEMYLVMRMRWLCRWMCRVLRVTTY
ncbi:hypothetical protein TCDM_13653 [Trypanosoma cruzi Dm28c]|uniref:Mucin TcMUCII n=1 Tax=Trypanosoma cruzi Dm28c TaxID=1416333 RepID=V5AS54_TRYCR|nr:hypothetical protein TCDM_13653 [Trypanosoma cruzi Dm28c]